MTPPPPHPHDAERRRDPRAFLGVIVLLGYAFAASGVENLYPLSRFPMYAGSGDTATARVMVRVDGGPLREITSFEGWSCPALPPLEGSSCGDVRGIGYIEREQETYLRTHPLGTRPGRRVELVRRVFSFDGIARPAACTIGSCEAAP